MRQLEKTGKVEQQLRGAVGADANLSNLAVFETIAINNLPINKKGTLFEGAVMNVSHLREMAAFVNAEKKLPLQMMHDLSENLPVGRVFAADVVQGTTAKGQDIVELRHLFYVSTDTQQGKDLAAKIDSGTINEVSVGVRSQHMHCSECGFDYMSEEATIMHILERTCENGHAIGVDGVHVRLEGLDKYFEMSLVSRGAADHAVILDRRQSVMAKQELKLAASEHEKVSASLVLFAMRTEGDPIMNLNQADYDKFVAELREKAKAALEAKDAGVVKFFTDLPKEVTAAQSEEFKTKLDAALKEFKPAGGGGLIFTMTMEDVIALKASNTQLTSQVTDLTKQNGELTAALAAKGTEVMTLTAQVKNLEPVKAEKDKAVAFLTQVTEKAIVAASLKDKTVPADVDGIVALLTEAQAVISKFPAGGIGLSADAGGSKGETASGADAAYMSKSSVKKGA